MSWITVTEGHCFPIQNLPFGIFSSNSRNHLERRIGVAIGDYVLDLKAIQYAGLLDDLGFDSRVFTSNTLNGYMALDKNNWRATRSCITSLLSSESEDRRLRDNHILQQESIFPASEIDMHLPAEISDYTDFYSSKEHATNVGIMFRGVENALQPNWLHLPVGYHGRASSIVVSGTDVVRPHGQLQAVPLDPKAGSSFGPSKQLDFELEMAFFVGGMANPIGKPVTMAEAEDRIFGVVLMNDWSARDVQAWEYVPLGPFTSKNFCTSISPWVVSMDALGPARCCPSAGSVQCPPPLPYLVDPQYSLSAFDVKLEVSIEAAHSHAGKGEEEGRVDGGCGPCVVSSSNMRNLYWSAKQQLVHHSVSGCPMKPGDLLGTGTISGPTDSAMGSMLELSWKGSRDVPLNRGVGSESGTGLDGHGQARRFLEDGDTVKMSGYAEIPPADGQGGGDLGVCVKGYKIGFGCVTGKVLPALPLSYFTAPSIHHTETTHALHHNGAATHTERTKTFYTAPALQYTDFKLYSYWRSTCSWRVRIALALKGVQYEYVPVNLLARYTETLANVGIEQSTVSEATFGVVSPAASSLKTPLNQVPVLDFKSIFSEIRTQLTQSIAIIEFLDQLIPSHAPLLPSDPLLRARVRQIAEIVSSGVQPLQSIGIIKHVRSAVVNGHSMDGLGYAKLNTEVGLAALEDLLGELRTAALHAKHTHTVFSAGTIYPTLADLCVVPQLYNARERFGILVSHATHPHLCAVEDACAVLEAFSLAAPNNQPDAV